MDGVLTKAIEAGQWVLLNNANLCSATVLDRLNPLLEPEGVLLLNEAGASSGQARILKAHPNFRLIFAQDPRRACSATCFAQQPLTALYNLSCVLPARCCPRPSRQPLAVCSP